ncbi:hypothetical protein OROGR_021328 [Orobanche gracilis]
MPNVCDDFFPWLSGTSFRAARLIQRWCLAATASIY